jgi:hypothetical protein
MKEKIEINASSGEKLILNSDGFDIKTWNIVKKALNNEAKVLIKKADLEENENDNLDLYEIQEENKKILQDKFFYNFRDSFNDEVNEILEEIALKIKNNINYFAIEDFFSNYVYDELLKEIPQDDILKSEESEELINKFLKNNKNKLIDYIKFEVKYIIDNYFL